MAISEPHRHESTSTTKTPMREQHDPRRPGKKAPRTKTATTSALTPDKCKHIYSISAANNILRELNCMASNARKNRTRTIHTGAPKEDTTYLQNNMTYNDGTQQRTCNMRNMTEQAQDVRNMTRHILWHKKRKIAAHERTKKTRTYYIRKRTPDKDASSLTRGGDDTRDSNSRTADRSNIPPRNIKTSTTSSNNKPYGNYSDT